MIDMRHRLHWEERFERSAWSCRMRVWNAPVGSLMVEGGSGACPLMLRAPDAELVRARIERALAWAREPQAYR
jgi:hypothetical protein